MPSLSPTSPSLASERISLAPLIGALLLAPVVGGLLGLGLAVAGEWHSVTSKWTAAETVGAAAGCWLMAGLIGLLVTSVISRCEARRIPMAILVSSALRAGIALFDGLFVALIFKPDPRTFWVAFLLSGLLCLVLETAWSMLAVRRFNARTLDAAPSVGVSST